MQTSPGAVLASGGALVKVNHDAPGNNSQFFSWLDIDQSTGNVAVSWYDARNDDGSMGPGDTDGIGVSGLDCLAFRWFAELSGTVPLVDGTTECDPTLPGDNGREWEIRTYFQVAF